MIWGQHAKQMESRAGAYPISSWLCLMTGPVKATEQVMHCFQIVDASGCHRHCKKKKKSYVEERAFDLKTTVNSAPDLTGLFEMEVKCLYIYVILASTTKLLG